jgi:hypothetical protein
MARSPKHPQTWPGSVARRLLFERGVRGVFRSLRGRPFPRVGAGGFRYSVVVPVPYFELRNVTIVFAPGSTTPAVYADGPRESPHRYENTSLCMWHPGDPSARRWRFEDGLIDLVDAIVAHLFREAFWRETGEWLGDEATHTTGLSGPDTQKEAA